MKLKIKRFAYINTYIKMFRKFTGNEASLFLSKM